MAKTVEELEGLCTGCSVCFSVCEAGAIAIERNETGFYEAVWKKDSCIHCGCCAKVCIKNPDNFHGKVLTDQKSVYAAQTRASETLMHSTSGGVAFELAKYMLEQGIPAAGVIYHIGNMAAETVILHDLKELELLQGSKYLQSSCAKAYRTIITELRADREKKFIVFGTPCQIYGLSKAAELYHVRENLYLIDLFCHGVPSGLLWETYLTEAAKRKELKGKINEVAFRDKRYGWGVYTLKLRSEEKEYYETSSSSSFYKIYFDHAALNPSCFKCKLRGNTSKADLRLGDFWSPHYADRKDGISAVIVLTDQGEELWKQVKEKLLVFDKHDIKECISHQSIHDYESNEKQRELFYRLLKQNLSLKKIIRSYRKTFRIKKRVRLLLKDIAALLPEAIRIYILKRYRSLKYKKNNQ